MTKKNNVPGLCVGLPEFPLQSVEHALVGKDAPNFFFCCMLHLTKEH